jgi:mRNA interferase MazF
MNNHLATIVVCPITSQSKNYPTRVSFDLERQTNWIVIDQIRTIDQSRITKSIGNLDEETIEKVKSIIRETFVD